MKHMRWIALPLTAALITLAYFVEPATSQTVPGDQCLTCHAQKVADMGSGKHATLPCGSCHEGANLHVADATVPKDPALYPKVHFDKEVCATCHADQYNTFLIAAGGRTIYGGSDAHDPTDPNDPPPPKGWSKTADLPYWNVLIDGHPFVLETYEDRPMAVNQIEHQETIRPGSESCMACHGTKLAYYMGIVYKDAAGQVKTEQMTTQPDGSFAPLEVLIKGGTYLPPAANDPSYPLNGTWNNPASTVGTGHLIYDGTSYREPAGGVWEEAVTVSFIPNGSRVSTYIDAVNAARRYEVKTLVTLPAPVTVSVRDVANLGTVIGTVTFQTLASYPEAGADINGVAGCKVDATTGLPVNANCTITGGLAANLARDWIYAAMEAMAFDGLDYEFDPLHTNPATGFNETHFSGKGANWPSVQSGQLCNQCHDSHSGKPRIIKKSLIEAIAVRGINPYSPSGKQVRTFDQATRQDKIIAQCAQCHSEYVGGYSANDGRDRDYFPWAKPADLELQYWSLFNYQQDWTHGGPVAPWQSSDANARGFLPYGERYQIGAPLVKVQHPEAEMFLNSPMYNAGATCTDCHSARVTRPDGSRYTSHWFTSPLKIMDGYSGTTFKGEHIPGDPITMAPQNPCVRCHTTDTPAQSRQRIKDQQDQFYFLQERTQVALVNALRYIREQQTAGINQSANIQTYQRASMRWEYYTQAENSMSFHNNPEAMTEVANARLWVDAFIPWPLTPVKARVTSTGADTLTLAFFDQANDEAGFYVERATALEGPYVRVADIPTPNGANIGDVEWTDTGLTPGTKYFYRIAAHDATQLPAGTSVFSIWAAASTEAVVAITAPSGLSATAAASNRIDLAWTDNSTNETGFRIERASDAAFTTGLVVLNATANATSYSDAGLTAGTTYYYRVFAVNAAGSSGASNTASATTLTAPPAAPSNLVVSAAARTSVSLAWRDNANNETGFYVERSTDGGTTWTRVATLAANATTYTNSGLTRRKTYWYRVQAYGAAGVSAYSNVVSAKTR